MQAVAETASDFGQGKPGYSSDYVLIGDRCFNAVVASYY